LIKSLSIPTCLVARAPLDAATLRKPDLKRKALYPALSPLVPHRQREKSAATLILLVPRCALVALLLFAGRATEFCRAAESPTAKEEFEPISVHMEAHANLAKEELRPIWRFFGADEPNYATMKNGKKLIGELGALRPKQVYFRAHNLLTSGDGKPALKWGSTGAYDEDEGGHAVYNWTIVDGIFDTYLERGVRPYVQVGFMPKALSVKPEPYQHHWTPAAKYDEIYTGWAYPPTSYQKWAELVFQWTKHCVEKYGRAEVESWYWEVWNEANIGYWRGTPEEFRKLHDYAIDGVRRALPTAKVGGADSAGSGGKFTRDFIEHCLRGTNYATGNVGTPLDFVSFHAKGAPIYTNGHVRMGLGNHLRVVDDGLRLVASFPELKQTPIVIGESDPEGCAACQGPSLAYRNGTMYSSYTAACFARKHELALRYGVNLEGALTWAFEFEDQPYFAGFRSLASNGIDKPVLNVFRMFSQMSGQRVSVESDHAASLESILKNGVRGEPDIAAMASLDKNKLTVLVWHYHDDDVPGPTAAVELKLSGLPSIDEVKLEHFRIDEKHSNAFAAWQRAGSPARPTAEQYAQLEAAGQLTTVGPTATVEVKDNAAVLKFTLPRQGVSLLKLHW
jgi:xylan 1,4-beta-xylosidase